MIDYFAWTVSPILDIGGAIVIWMFILWAIDYVEADNKV